MDTCYYGQDARHSSREKMMDTKVKVNEQIVVPDYNIDDFKKGYLNGYLAILRQPPKSYYHLSLKVVHQTNVLWNG